MSGVLRYIREEVPKRREEIAEECADLNAKLERLASEDEELARVECALSPAVDTVLTIARGA